MLLRIEEKNSPIFWKDQLLRWERNKYGKSGAGWKPTRTLQVGAKNDLNLNSPGV